MRANSVVNSKHNLSVSGPGSVKAEKDGGICVFCHAVHNAGSETPLWNHTLSNVSDYKTYSSATMKSGTVGPQPNGASKLCLSCHDGTVALGSLHSRKATIAMQGGVTTMPAGPSNMGTDLSHDHPISFQYDSKLYKDSLGDLTDPLCDPTKLPDKVRLQEKIWMQCTTCHDPHDNQFPNFLVMDNTNSALCATCHINSPGSAHSMSAVPITPAAAAALSAPAIAAGPVAGSARAAAAPASVQRVAVSKLPSKRVAKTVAANGCDNCHAPHGAGGRARLLLHAREEQTCFVCHNGTVGRQNLVQEFNKLSVHPVLQSSQLHSPRENLLNAPRHVACADCHNSHIAKQSNSHAKKNPTIAVPAASGAILGVRGVNRDGIALKSVAREYELCLRCHGDSVARNPSSVNRISPETNKRRQFDPSNSSYHPVVAVGRNSNVPSLIPPYNAGATIQCTDCHNNDQGPGAGGTGPAGPHGSAFAPLLERRLVTVDQTLESAANYALCYKCHSRDSIVNDQSFRAFSSTGQGDRGHRFHIQDQKTACTTCHDSHGVANNQHLINFNPSYVTASSNGRIEYKSTGLFRGNCTLSCHGFDHAGTAYPNALTASPAKFAPRKR